MTQLQDQLKNVSKTLASLSKQLEGISKKIVKVPTAKSPAKRKVATKAKTKAAPKKMRVAVKATASKDKTVLDSVFDVIRRSRNGVSIAKLKEKNVLALVTPAKDIRFVTHKDVDDEDVERAIAAIREILL